MYVFCHFVFWRCLNLFVFLILKDDDDLLLQPSVSHCNSLFSELQLHFCREQRGDSTSFSSFHWLDSLVVVVDIFLHLLTRKRPRFLQLLIDQRIIARVESM